MSAPRPTAPSCSFHPDEGHPAGATVSYTLLVLAVATLLMLGLQYLVRRTRLGKPCAPRLRTAGGGDDGRGCGQVVVSTFSQLGPGQGGGCAGGPALPDLSLHGLYRHQGVYRRRVGRHRQHARGRWAGWCWGSWVYRQWLYLAPLQGRHRLCRAHRAPPPAAGVYWASRSKKGMVSGCTLPIRAGRTDGPAAGLGRDEWVAREGRAGAALLWPAVAWVACAVPGRARTCACAGWAVGAASALPLWAPDSYVVRVAGLALSPSSPGLNVVAGMGVPAGPELRGLLRRGGLSLCPAGIPTLAGMGRSCCSCRWPSGDGALGPCWGALRCACAATI